MMARIKLNEERFDYLRLARTNASGRTPWNEAPQVTDFLCPSFTSQEPDERVNKTYRGTGGS